MLLDAIEWINHFFWDNLPTWYNLIYWFKTFRFFRRFFAFHFYFPKSQSIYSTYSIRNLPLASNHFDRYSLRRSSLVSTQSKTENFKRGKRPATYSAIPASAGRLQAFPQSVWAEWLLSSILKVSDNDRLDILNCGRRQLSF